MKYNKRIFIGKHQLNIFRRYNPFRDICIMNIRFHKAVMLNVVLQESGRLYYLKVHLTFFVAKITTYIKISVGFVVLLAVNS